jgi:hypothetical protein
MKGTLGTLIDLNFISKYRILKYKTQKVKISLIKLYTITIRLQVKSNLPNYIY